MSSSRFRFPITRLLACLAIVLALWPIIGRCAEEDAPRKVEAGPFSVMVPLRWAESATVAKRAIQPVYTPDAWKEYLANEAKKKTREWYSLAQKPAYANRPEHWVIKFPKLVLPGQKFDPKESDDDPTAPQILIHRTAEWGAAFKDGKVDEPDAKKMAKKLRDMVESQDPTQNPAFMDAHLEFIVEKKKIQFTGGHGFRVLAQWNIEPTLVAKGQFHYLFLGISDDNSCQIIATFHIDLPGLPEDDVKAEHLGFSIGRYEELSKQFPKYEQAAKKWLSENAGKAKPSLAELDAMMSSLVVHTWK